MNFKIFKADKTRKKYSIRGPLFDGTFVKLPGSRDLGEAQQIAKNIDLLNRCRKFGEPPSAELSEWIANLSAAETERYVDLGLLERRYVDKQRPILDLLPDFVQHLKARNEAKSRYPDAKADRIRRVVGLLMPDVSITDLTEDDVLNAVKNITVTEGKRKGQPLAQKTQREYLIDIKSFCAWMVLTGRAAVNPLEHMEIPSAKGAPVRNRRPLTIQSFYKLMTYLRSAPLKAANGYTFRWKREDRLMTYWMAAMTGLRANELKTLTPSSITYINGRAFVTVEGWNAKNRTKAAVPLEGKLAEALNEYCKGRDPYEPLLRVCKLHMLAKVFKRDLDGAGIPHEFDDGSLTDFHALRSTAICWWLTHNRLNLLQVRSLARLKTLALVQDYSRCFDSDDDDLTCGSPDFSGPDSPSGNAAA